MYRVLQQLSLKLFNHCNNKAIIFFVSVFSFCLPVFAQTSWNKLEFPTNEHLNMVRFASADTGWIIGTNYIYKTTDGGVNWNSQDPVTGGGSDALCVLNKDTVVFGDWGSGGIRRTTDGGATWVTTDNSGFIYTDIDFITPRIGMATAIHNPGDGVALVRKTTDGGATWNTITEVNLGKYQNDFEALSFTDTLNGWTVTYRGSIYNTTDGGNNWHFQDSVQQSPPDALPEAPFRDIQVIPGGRGWVVGGISSFSQIGETADGSSWTKSVIAGSNSSLYEIEMVNADTGYFVGTNIGPMNIGKTTDGGLTWNNVFSAGSGFVSISIIGDSVGYVVGDTGAVYKMKPATLTSISGTSAGPVSFSLAQNYPNPFNPSTIIRYTIPQTGFVKLSVFNILGQEIKTLVRETQTAGEHKIAFNANGLSGGVYFYRIESGTYSQTKKLILLK